MANATIEFTKGQALKRLKSVQGHLDEGTYELVHETLRLVCDSNYRMQTLLNKNGPLTRVRELVEKIHAKPDQVAIDIKAMREEELLHVIQHWKTTKEEALVAYALLRSIDINKYPEL